MRFRWLMVIALPGFVALSACGSSSKTSTTATTVAESTTAATTAASTPAVTSGATVKTAPNSMGTILVDASGMTLYVFDHDTGGKPTCVGACAGTWPALLAPTSGAPTGVSGLGVVARPDGGQQVTHNGRPLHHYSGDTQPGETKGNGIGGIWHVVILGTPPGTAPTTTKAGSGGYGY